MTLYAGVSRFPLYNEASVLIDFKFFSCTVLPEVTLGNNRLFFMRIIDFDYKGIKINANSHKKGWKTVVK